MWRRFIILEVILNWNRSQGLIRKADDDHDDESDSDDELNCTMTRHEYQ
jgi:hypothetical protein